MLALTNFRESFDKIIFEYLTSVAKGELSNNLPEALAFISSTLFDYHQTEEAWHDTRNGASPMHPGVPLSYWDALTLV